MKRLRVFGVLLPVVLLSASVTAGGISTSEASTGDGGSFVPVTPVRIGDTSNGTGFSAAGSFAPRDEKHLRVTSRGEIPAASEVSAVVLDVAAASTADSTLSVSPWGEPINAASLRINGNDGWSSTTMVVKPSTGGGVSIYNSAGTTRVNVDVQGYFTKASRSGSPGGFVALTPTRLIDSRTSLGLPGKLAGGTTYQASIGGQGEIPSDASAVFANVRVLNATGQGGLRVGPSDASVTQSTPSLVNYESGRTYDQGGALPLGPDGKVKFLTSSATTGLDVVVDVQGYFTSGADGASYHPLSPTRTWNPTVLWNSASSAEGNLQANEARTIKVGGQLGMPDDLSLGSVMLSIQASGWTRTGHVSVVNADLPDDNGTSSLALSGSTGDVRQSTAFVEVSGENEITVRNKSAGPAEITLRAHGWFQIEGTDHSPPEEDPVGFVEGPVSVKGMIADNGATSSSAEVLVTVFPSDEYLSALDEGEEVPEWRIGSVPTQADGSFNADFSTEELPAEFKDGDGAVNVVLNATDGSSSLQYETTLQPAAAASAPAARTAAASPTSDEDEDETDESGATVTMDLGTGESSDPSDPSSTWEDDGEEGQRPDPVGEFQ